MRHSQKPAFARARAACVLLLAMACGGGATSDSGTPTGPTGATDKPTHPGGTLSGKITLPAGPTGISIADNGTTFVTLIWDQSVARFPVDATTMTEAPIPIGPDAIDVVLNRAGTTAYVAGGGGIKTIDVASGAVKSTVDFGANAFEVKLSPDETRLFATAGGSTVWSVPTAGGTPTSSKLSGFVYGVALSPSGKVLFVARENGVFFRLDPATLAIQAQAVVTGPSIGDLVVSRDGSEVYAVQDGGVLIVLDAVTLTTLGFVDVGPGASGMAMSPDGAQLYITSFFGTLTIVDRAKRSVVTQLTLGGIPRHIAFDKLGKTALVANEDGWVDVIK